MVSIKLTLRTFSLRHISNLSDFKYEKRKAPVVLNEDEDGKDAKAVTMNMIAPAVLEIILTQGDISWVSAFLWW